jgi:hypothetical protein
MTTRLRSALIGGAIVGPPLLGILPAELNYLCGWWRAWWAQWQQSWPFSDGSWPLAVFYIVPQLVAIAVLFRILPWRWWVKCFAVLLFTAISFVFTVLGWLFVAAAHGDGI